MPPAKGGYAEERAATSQHRSVRRGVDMVVANVEGRWRLMCVPPGKRLMCADIGELAIDMASC